MKTVTIDETGIPIEKTRVLFEDAYDKLLPEMKSLSDDELLTVNLDIPSAIFTVLGIQPELNALRDDIVKLHVLDGERVLNVGMYARALGRAHALYLAAVHPADTIRGIIEEGTALREVLISDAHALVRRKLMDGERLRELTTPVGYKNLAFDLELLGAVFRAHYPKIQGKCGVTEAEIVRALEIAATIAEVIGEREQSAARVAEAADIRTRAFTLFVRTYDEARRAVTFLRWRKEDVNDITPSLYMNRGRRKDPVESAAPTGPAAPPAIDLGVAPATDMSIAASAIPAPFAPATPVVTPAPTPVAPKPELGTPNAGPFLS